MDKLERDIQIYNEVLSETQVKLTQPQEVKFKNACTLCTLKFSHQRFEVQKSLARGVLVKIVSNPHVDINSLALLKPKRWLSLSPITVPFGDN